MMAQYLRERASWLLFFALLQLLILFIAWLDPQFTWAAAGYLIFLSALLFSFFFAYRYNQETRFYRRLAEEEPHSLPEARELLSPFEELVQERLAQMLEHFKKETDHLRLQVEQEKEELLAWIHEVKTPLTAMQLMVEQVEDEKLRAKLQVEWLRIHLLLDRQLHEKRIPTMFNDLYVEKVALSPLIRKEIKQLQSWCLMKGIGFDLQLEVEEVLSDAKWLAFILRQLLSNSVKYSQSSDISIRSFRRGEHICLEVADQGSGIDLRDLPRIFDKGFTSTSRAQQHKATGMGLYLMKKAADSLGIQVAVESRPQQGTRFTLIFPRENEMVELMRG